MRSRQRSQAVVEFGIIAITFTLIMFAIADFGLLLNDWLSVSSGVRGIARNASVGMVQTDLELETRALKIPGVTADPHFAGVYCCSVGSALVLTVIYYDQCTPGVGPCNPVLNNKLDSHYWSGGIQGGCPHPCALPDGHPAAPGPPPPLGACGHPACPGDSVVVTLTAAGAQVITPLVRPFFSQPNICPDSSTPSRCYVPLSSTVTMRFEGDLL